MLKLGSLLLLACMPALLAARSMDGESDAWAAAMALKSKGDMPGAAAAFETFIATYPQSKQVLAARVEVGVSWFGVGKNAQVNHRNTPKTTESFDKAIAAFESVLTEHPESPFASRASSMEGSTYLFSGQLELAEAAYSAVLDKYNADRNYVGKALERRAFVRRHLLQPKSAIEDMNRWLKEFGAPPDSLTNVRSDLANSALLEKPAPAWAPETWIQGAPLPFDASRGDVVALYFFATWCPNCAKERPFLVDFEHRYAAQGVHFIAVLDHSKNSARTETQTPDYVRAFLKAQNIPFTVFMDNGGTATAYGVTSLPHLVLIDREGKVRWRDNPSNLADWTVDTLLHEGLEPADKSKGK